MDSVARKEFYEQSLRASQTKLNNVRGELGEVDMELMKVNAEVSILTERRKRLEAREREALAYVAAVEMLLKSDV